MKEFFGELTRRKVFKVGAAYIIVAWLAVQVASIVFPAFDAPPWVLRIFILVCLLGFPISLVFAWAFELTPEGLKTDARSSGSKFVLVFITVLVLLAFAWYFKGQPTYREPSDAQVPATVQNTITSTAPAGKNSIAVMPFVNMSSDKEQEYFSDGMTEEILNALANVPNLAVTARTSVFSLKGQNKDIREIGKLLGVAYVLEGSVRKAGDEVRITAQLIRADNGFHLWSETYDRKLENVFDMQAEIAGAIAKALELPLGLGGNASLVSERSADPQAYALYLQARSAYRARGEGVKKSIELYRAALKRDPKFAPAWAGLASSLVVSQFYLAKNEKHLIPQLMMDAETAGKKALTLSPDLLSAHIALGGLYTNQWRWVLAEQHFKKALALNPTDPEFYFAYTDWLTSTGRFDEALQAAEKAVVLDPLAPMYKNLYGYLLNYVGRKEEAIAQLEAGYALAPNVLYLSRNLAITYFSAGKIEEAKRVAENYFKALAANGESADSIAAAKYFYEVIYLIAEDPSLYESQRKALGENGSILALVFPTHIDDLFIEVGKMIDAHTTGVDPVVLLRSPYFDGHRKDPRYIRLLNKSGFDDEGNIR